MEESIRARGHQDVTLAGVMSTVGIYGHTQSIQPDAI